MNIFVSDLSPIRSAVNLDDKRVKHMPKESLEMLMMAHHRNTGEYLHAPLTLWRDNITTEKFNELYNNHCTLWVGRNRENAYWLYRHLVALFNEYKHRFGGQHYLEDLFLSISHFIPTALKEPKSFTNATPYPGSNIIENYRNILLYKWNVTDEVRPVVWTKRNPPSWAIIKTTKTLDLFDNGIEQVVEDDDLPF